MLCSTALEYCISKSGKNMNILSVSWKKTIRFNLHYFGIRGLKLPVLIFRNFTLKKLGGTVEIKCGAGFASVRLGQQMVGIVDSKGSWSSQGNVVFEGNCKIGSGSKLAIARNAQMVIGDNVSITGRTDIVCQNRIVIGKDSLLSWDVLLMDTDFHKIVNEQGKQTNEHKEIVIGEHTWVGCRCTILGGAKISNDTVIAAGSCITKAFHDKQVLIGGVNTVLKDKIKWQL